MPWATHTRQKSDLFSITSAATRGLLPFAQQDVCPNRVGVAAPQFQRHVLAGPNQPRRPWAIRW